jgi:hypothetical protein
MLLSERFAIIILAFGSACAEVQVVPDASDRAILLIENATYDGHRFAGRVLVTSSKGEMQIDARTVSQLDVRSVTECATGQATSVVARDYANPPPKAGDILSLRPGVWFGKDVRFDLTPRNVDIGCVDATFELIGSDGQGGVHRIAEQRLRLEKK